MKKILAMIVAVAMVMSMAVISSAIDTNTIYELDLGTIVSDNTNLSINLPETIASGTKVTVHLTGTTDTDFRIWLGSFHNAASSISYMFMDGADFETITEITTTGDSTTVTLKTINSWDSNATENTLSTIAGVTITSCKVFIGTMAEYEAAVEAAIPRYAINVTNGTANVEEAKAGEEITVTANAPASGEEFIGWQATGITLDDASANVVTFTMPANDVTLVAKYGAVIPAPVEITDIVFKSDVDFDPENNPEGFTAYLYSVNGTVVDAADQLDPYYIRCNEDSDVWELYLEWRFNGDLYTGERGEENYNVELITPNQTWNARSAHCYGDYYSDGSLNIDVYFEFSEDYLVSNNEDSSSLKGLSGFVVISSEYHAQIGIGKSLIIVNAHDFNLNGDCVYCGYHTEVEEDVVEIIDPTEPSTEEEEDDTVEVTPDEEPEEDENPKTGLALALVPMMIAAAVAVITKK